jgi:hypothetical protein
MPPLPPDPPVAPLPAVPSGLLKLTSVEPLHAPASASAPAIAANDAVSLHHLAIRALERWLF